MNSLISNGYKNDVHDNGEDSDGANYSNKRQMKIKNEPKYINPLKPSG
jgi:hypothetical protein